MQLSPELQALGHFKDRGTQVYFVIQYARLVEQPHCASCMEDADTRHKRGLHNSVISVPSIFFWTRKNRARIQGSLPREYLQLMWRKSAS